MKFKKYRLLLGAVLCSMMLISLDAIAQTRVLYSNDGNSVPVNYCRGPWDLTKAIINEGDGRPAPSILISGGPGNRNDPYILPGLSIGQVLHATMDMEIDGDQAYSFFSFGDSAGGCDPNGPMPLPYFQYLPGGGWGGMAAFRMDESGHQACDFSEYTMPIGVWVSADFTFTPNANGFYDYVLKMDGATVLSGRSYAPLGTNENLVMSIGIGSGYNRGTIGYDNIRVEVLGTGNPLPTPTPSGKSRIVYMSNQTGPYEIWIMNDDGSGKTQLTFDSEPSGSIEPQFSSDGRQIAFLRSNELYVMNADGSGQTPILSLQYESMLFEWGRSGWIYYSSAGGLHRVRPDGSGDTHLADSDTMGISESPDGKRIVYVDWHCCWTPSNTTHLLNLETGTDTIILPSDGHAEYYVSYAHLSNKVIFEQADDPRGYDNPANIWMMNDDGTGKVQLTTAAANEQYEWPKFSPDDSKILFYRLRRGSPNRFDIVVINADGSGFISLSDPSASWYEGAADWGPAANTPPIANAGADQSIQVGANCSAAITLDGTGSSDPDGDPLAYTWTGPFGTVTGPTPTVTLPKGTHTITLAVDDGRGGTATDTVVVTVVDKTAPIISIWPGPRTLYIGSAASTPMPDLTGEVRATDNCTPASALVITQTPAPGTPIGVGTANLTIQVADSSGNAATNSTTVTVSSATAVKLSDSTGNPIAGGVVQFYSGSWQSFGVTGADGLAIKQISSGNYTFRMSWAGGNNDKVQNIATAPLVIFQTVKANVQLKDSNGAALDAGTAQYYGGSWIPFGVTSGGQVSRELLPGTYSFRITYAGISNDKVQNISADPTVIFRTTNVAVLLKDSSGASLDPGTVQYYGGSWLPFGSTTGGQVSRELLPGTISFRMTYGGFSNDKQQHTSQNPVVVFQTVRVTAQLLDSLGNPLDPGTVQYYASAWNAFGPTSGGQVQKELLPGTYSFRMIYGGFSNDKQQNVGANQLVVFQTVQVRVQLTDSAGNPLDTGTVQYYASAWSALGTTSGGQTQKELLPGTYSFRMSYAGGSVDKSQNVGSTPVVQFQTGKVLSSSGTCTSYYAGAWRTFVSGMELLPISYPFRFTSYPQTNYLITAGATTNIY